MAYGWGWDDDKFENSNAKLIFQTWKGKNDERQRIDRQEWERLRMLGSWVLAPYSKNMTPKKLLPLPWDVEESVESWKQRNKDILEQCDIIYNKSVKHN